MRHLLDKSVTGIVGKIGVIGGIIAVLIWSITILPEKDYLPYGNTNMVLC